LTSVYGVWEFGEFGNPLFSRAPGARQLWISLWISIMEFGEFGEFGEFNEEDLQI